VRAAPENIQGRSGYDRNDAQGNEKKPNISRISDYALGFVAKELINGEAKANHRQAGANPGHQGTASHH
jgi:hypothetical protein